MPVRVIGMIGVTPPAHSSTLLVIEGAISPSFIVDFAKAHEAAGFDMALVGYTTSSAEGFLVAMHAAGRTERLSYLVAHRPGFVAPTLHPKELINRFTMVGTWRESMQIVWLSFISASTPIWLHKTVNPNIVEGGFTSRCLFVVSNEPKRKIAWLDDDSDAAEEYQQLLVDLRYIREVGTKQGTITLTEGALSTFRSWYGKRQPSLITGKTDAEQEGDGDFAPKAERYQRAQEYLHLLKRTWASDAQFDYEGRFYRVRGAHSDVRPLQTPHPLIMFGGASEGALEMGAAECDVFAIYAEPRSTTAERILEFRARTARHGRAVGFSMSVRPIIAATEGAAWDKAKRILSGMTGSLGWSRQEREGVRAPVDNAGRRQFALAQEKDVHDERLWMGITKATGALGNTSCLVGTAEQVADSLLSYYRLGVASFLIRGFDPVSDTVEFGRELIPRLKAAALEIDQRQLADAS